MGVIGALPWWAKLSAKLVLSRLPVSYATWRKLGLFRHGEMDQSGRAMATFRSYFDKANAVVPLPAGFTSLELGPGDSVLAGIVAKGYGAERVYMVDAGAFAASDMNACMEVVRALQHAGMTAPDISRCRSLAEVYACCDISYLTRGTASFSEIPDSSIDFFWSQVVLEHVPRAEFPRLLRELRRVVRPGAVGVHSIDFRDHLGGGRNNLRFSEKIWESSVFHNSGFYTNRIPCSEMLRLFENAGFEVKVLHRTNWPELPLARKRLAEPFQRLSDEDLRTAEVEVLLRPVR